MQFWIAFSACATYIFCMSENLSPRERRVVEAANRFAFVNPFSSERDSAEARFLEVLGAPDETDISRKIAAFSDWVENLPLAKRDYRNFQNAEREAMRTVLLFENYYREIRALDTFITQQLAKGERSCSVPFAAQCLARLESYGFTREEAVRYLGIFYQLRRAHYFIVRSLKGKSPCMFDFRRRLWKSVFTEDVRCYERHLWNRMEDFSTLLLGETGTGKGTAAAAIGRSGYIAYLPEKREFAESFNHSFLSINLAEFPETLIEAELFGYRKGAFTGAVESHEGVFARCSPHGAIFLDEIGEVNTSIQVKLLHVLQDRTFSPVGSRDKLRFHGRVITATNRSLDELRGDKIFRDDFFYRISSDIIEVPTLRRRLAEEPGELDLLLEIILQRLVGDKWAELLSTVRHALLKSPGGNYIWPGNVRELEQAVRRVLLTGKYEVQFPRPKSPIEEWGAKIQNLSYTADDLLTTYTRHAVQTCGTRAEAARKLGLDVRTLQKYLQSEPRA
jgi:hypothetical protein